MSNVLAPEPSPLLSGLGSYSPIRPRGPIDLRLDGNEGAPPPQDLVVSLVAELVADVRPYPDAQSLAPAVAALCGVDPSWVLITAGADDALDRCCRAFLSPGRSLVMTVPTFEMIDRYAQLTGATTVGVTWEGGRYPVEQVCAAIRDDTALVVVVSPNNPTGSVANLEDIDRIASAAPRALVVLDAAYVEFADVDPTEEALRIPNVVVIRTFSKAWGLAGLRVGYALGDPALLPWLASVGHPFAVAGPSVTIARGWLARGPEAVASQVRRVCDERSRLTELLEQLGARPEPSQANFVLARFDDAALVRNALAGLGIAVRYWPGREGLGDALRITCPGRERDFARLVAALEAALAPEALLFDMDGVLADVSESYGLAVQQTCARWNVRVNDEQIARAKAKGGLNNDWELTRHLLANQGVDVPQGEVTGVFERLYQGMEGRPGLHEAETPLLDAAAVRRLAAGRKTAVVTGRPRRDAESFLVRFGLEKAFDAVVCMEDAPRKPDPAPVRLALQRLGVRRAWMIGDMPDDITAARAAGVVPVGVLAPGVESETMSDALASAGAIRVLRRAIDLQEILP